MGVRRARLNQERQQENNQSHLEFQAQEITRQNLSETQSLIVSPWGMQIAGELYCNTYSPVVQWMTPRFMMMILQVLGLNS